MDMNSYLSQMRQIASENNAYSSAQAEKQMNFQSEEAQKVRDFNAAQSTLNRDWQERMSNSAHQREVEDLKKAGLNPVLSITGSSGGASTPSGSSATAGSTPTGAKGDVDTSLVGAVASMFNSTLNSATAIKTAQISASAVLGASANAMTASMYGADQHLEGVKTQTKQSELNAQKELFGKMITGIMSANSAKYSADKSYEANSNQLDWQKTKYGLDSLGSLFSAGVNALGKLLK